MTPFTSCAFYTSAWTRPGICEPALWQSFSEFPLVLASCFDVRAVTGSSADSGRPPPQETLYLQGFYALAVGWTRIEHHTHAGFEVKRVDSSDGGQANVPEDQGHSPRHQARNNTGQRQPTGWCGYTGLGRMDRRYWTANLIKRSWAGARGLALAQAGMRRAVGPETKNWG